MGTGTPTSSVRWAPPTCDSWRLKSEAVLCLMWSMHGFAQNVCVCVCALLLDFAMEPEEDLTRSPTFEMITRPRPRVHAQTNRASDCVWKMRELRLTSLREIGPRALLADRVRSHQHATPTR